MYKYLTFTSWNGTPFVYDVYNDEWVMADKADLSEFYKYAVPDDCALQYANYAKRRFTADGCICDGKGITFNTYTNE